MYILKPEICKNQSKLAAYKSAFTAGECEKIISLFHASNPQTAGIDVDGRFAGEIRKSRVAWLQLVEEHKWIWEKLEAYIMDANKFRWNFQLSGILEALQLTEYAPGGHYSWHEDNSEPSHSTRKLSLVVQLSDPATYQGGDLVIFPAIRAPREQGTISFFPSYYTHKVEPVKEGVRYSLVTWVTGEPFR
jgi:PKHD-type hydroxylase